MSKNTYNTSNSENAFKSAKEVIPGGVNSPARAFSMVDGPPLFIDEADGEWIEDVDGNRYFDLVNSWGPMIFGHNPPKILDAVKEQLDKGMSYGAPTEIETQMADLITDLIPSIDVIRMVNSGTEATMSALRVIRGATNRDLILKFKGCYHGHGDSLLVEAGSGGATLGEPDSSGVPKDLANLTVTAPFGDIQSLDKVFAEFGDRLAGAIIEPVAGNMGLIKPSPEFLKRLRELTRAHDALLVFDEVMTGFRVALGGAQSEYDIKPDLTTLGKIIGGGMPVGAYGGREEIMREVAPDGPVYQAGTLSGNPVAMRAGLETLKKLRDEKPYDKLESATEHIQTVFQEESSNKGIPLQFHRMGGMFSYYFTNEPVTDYKSASRTDEDLFRKFHRRALENGLYFPPSYFESSFVSKPLSTGDSLTQTLDRISKTFMEM